MANTPEPTLPRPRGPEPKLTREHLTASQQPEPEAAHVLSGTEAFVVILWAGILDLLDLTTLGEYLVTDVIAVLTLDIFFIYKGLSPIRMLAGQGGEVIPVLDVLPLYLSGAVWTVVQDRSKVLATVAKYIPKKPGAAGAGASRIGALEGAAGGSKVRDLAANAISKSEDQYRKLQTLQGKVPGIVRSVPGGTVTRGTQPDTGTSAGSTADPARQAGSFPAPQQAGAGSSRQTATRNEQFGANPDKEAPFPDTYYNFENEMLPQDLNELMDIDVTGEQTVRTGDAVPAQKQFKASPRPAAAPADVPKSPTDRELGLKP